MQTRRACHCCGLIQRIPELPVGAIAVCVRCKTAFATLKNGANSANRTAAAAVAAFVLFWPAILLPILTVQKLGQSSSSSLLVGIFELLHHGSWFVGIIVLLFSIVFPLLKIVALIELSLLQLLPKSQKAWTLRLMEKLGKWSMMDVMLLAFLVMLVKLGNVVDFEIGPAVVAFVLCVVMSVIASAAFDPHAIWEDESHE